MTRSDGIPWPCEPLPCVQCSVQERAGAWHFWCGRQRKKIIVGEAVPEPASKPRDECVICGWPTTSGYRFVWLGGYVHSNRPHCRDAYLRQQLPLGAAQP